jgi:DNA-binding NarL/FixJ family response regulator
MPVAIVDPLRAVRRIVAGAVDSDAFETPSWDALRDWISDQPSDAPIVLVASIIDEIDYQRIATLATSNRVTVVALLDDPTPEHYGRALRAGAAGVTSRDADPGDVAGVLAACRSGWAMVPLDAARELARAGSRSHRVAGIGDDEVQWIRAPADGATVAALADRVGYSEREMFRLLHDLYHRMGAKSRTEALVTAARWGLLETGDDAT